MNATSSGRMEQKLAEFRARRQAGNPLRRAPCDAPAPNADPGTDTPAADGQSKEDRPSNSQASPPTPQHKDQSDWLLNSTLGRWLASRNVFISNVSVLKVLLWLVLLGLFVELEFGLPFFVISLFYWMYEGLRTPTGREPGELSAYSVFNPDCQALLGSLTAEQLEGEMGYRPLANR